MSAAKWVGRALFAAFFAGNAAKAEPPLDGIIDSSFSEDGTIVLPFDEYPNAPLDAAEDVLVDAQKRTYVVGTVRTPSGNRIGVVRLRANGEVDLGYGQNGNGRVVAPGAGSYALTGAAAAFDPQGALVVAGTLVGNNESKVAVCRFSSSGSPIPFAGSDLQCASHSYAVGEPGVQSDTVKDILIQPDGKIVLVGYGISSLNPFREKAAILRLKPDATLDSTAFGTGGRTSFVFNSQSIRLTAAALQDNGKIVVACEATAFNSNESDPCVARVLSNGSLDNTFNGINNTGFKIFSTIDGNRHATFDAISLVPRPHPQIVVDQSFMVAGKLSRIGNPGAFYGLLARIRSDAELDDTFLGGWIMDSLGDSLVYEDVEQHADGTVTVAGTIQFNDISQFFASRFTRKGQRDNANFNRPAGYITVDMLPFVNDDKASAIAVTPARVLIAGTVQRLVQNNRDFGVAALFQDRIFADDLEVD